MEEENKNNPNEVKVLYAEGVEKTEESEAIVNDIIDSLKRVYDPEIPVDIYELGLIYAIEFLETNDPYGFKVRVDMTLTAPGCPVAGSMPGWVQNAVLAIPEIKECIVDLVWEPFWTPDRMSFRAKLELNML